MSKCKVTLHSAHQVLVFLLLATISRADIIKNKHSITLVLGTYFAGLFVFSK